MKRLLVLAALFAVFLPSFVSAQEAWRMTNFHARIEVRKDGSLLVTETISAEFLTPRHGIYRYVPYKGVDDAGKRYRLDIALDSVTMDGQPVQVDRSRTGSNVVWKIGDPDATLTGPHAYVLTYRVEGAVRMFEDFDEVYWNVTGHGWDAPLPKVTTDVVLPQIVGTETLLQRSACYTGIYGSAERGCESAADGGSATFTSLGEGNPLTIALGFPKGVIIGPSLSQRILKFLTRYGAWLLPFVAFAYAYRRWRLHGDDASHGSIAPEYEPPLGFRPAETQALISRASNAKDLAPTIVDLAVRGYLRIEESEKKVLLFSLKEYKLVRLKDPAGDPAVRAYEARLLERLFGGGNEVNVSALRNSFYKHVPEFKKGVMAALMERKMFVADPVAVRIKWLLLGTAVFACGLFVEGVRVPIFASGAIIAAFSWFMPKWSPEGHAAARQALGYKEFISKVEKHRAPWMEEQNIFFQVLPYAMIFGLGAKWAKAFEHLHLQPPSWYQGAHLAAWSPVAFNNAVNG